jgi:hypothetical protein
MLFLTASLGLANGQVKTKSDNLLLVSPSKFKLQAANIVYQGETCAPSDKTDEVYGSSEVIRFGNEVFYESHRFSQASRDDGLVVENFLNQTCRLYRMFGIAETAGQFNHDQYRLDIGTPPDATRGLYRVRNTLWMGSDGIGVAVLDLKKKTWSRYDLKSNVEAGDHLSLDYADDDYVFVTRGEFPGVSFHIYSVKRNKWLGLKAVSTKIATEYGYETAVVQITVDHRPYAKKEYMPIDSCFIGLEVIDNGRSYLVVKRFSETKTVFKIDKSQLEQVFKRK